MANNDGRVPAEPGSREPSPAVSAASGFDPSRVAWLHIRGQFTYHTEAHIVGTRAGLLALRSAIDDALANREAEASVCASDGEGYSLTVRRARSVNQMGSPTYIDEMARAVVDSERQWIAGQERRNWSLYQKIKEQVALRDSDRSGEASETGTGSTEGESAGPSGHRPNSAAQQPQDHPDAT